MKKMKKLISIEYSITKRILTLASLILLSCSAMKADFVPFYDTAVNSPELIKYFDEKVDWDSYIEFSKKNPTQEQMAKSFGDLFNVLLKQMKCSPYSKEAYMVADWTPLRQALKIKVKKGDLQPRRDAILRAFDQIDLVVNAEQKRIDQETRRKEFEQFHSLLDKNKITLTTKGDTTILSRNGLNLYIYRGHYFMMTWDGVQPGDKVNFSWGVRSDNKYQFVEGPNKVENIDELVDDGPWTYHRTAFRQWLQSDKGNIVPLNFNRLFNDFFPEELSSFMTNSQYYNIKGINHYKTNDIVIWKKKYPNMKGGDRLFTPIMRRHEDLDKEKWASPYPSVFDENEYYFFTPEGKCYTFRKGQDDLFMPKNLSENMYAYRWKVREAKKKAEKAKAEKAKLDALVAKCKASNYIKMSADDLDILEKKGYITVDGYDAHVYSTGAYLTVKNKWGVSKRLRFNGNGYVIGQR